MITLSAMFPVLVANDLLALKTFYEQNFGFTTVFFDDDFYLHLLHPDSGVQLGFMVPDHASQPHFLQSLAGTQGMVISFEVAEAKLAYESAVSSGLSVVFDLKVENFGQTHFMIEDPAGFVIDVVEHHDQ